MCLRQACSLLLCSSMAIALCVGTLVILWHSHQARDVVTKAVLNPHNLVLLGMS